MLFSGCKEGILIGSNIQSWKDVESTCKGSSIDESLSNIMLVSVSNLIETEQKNRRLITNINEVEYRSKELQNELKEKYEDRISMIIEKKDKEIDQLKERFKKYIEESKLLEEKHKEELNNLESRNSQAVSEL
jgi:seryl-tRNA synthetase